MPRLKTILKLAQMYKKLNPSVRIQSFYFQIKRVGFDWTKNSGSYGLNLFHDPTSDHFQSWSYIGLGFYWRYA